ncbi:lyase family protein [Treponema pedis]|uniref:lyase family protein n=1 Tax=Treponema pedis TaxID=409322 RepID=UPI0004944BED|nr:lyase family protein [Treponema pedis]
METRAIFKNISPIDHRYSMGGLYEDLIPFLSEEAGIVYCAKAEIALVKAHLKIEEKKENGSLPVLTPELEKILDKIALDINPSEVYEEEQKTQHNIRALVNVLKKKVPKETAPFVHLGATSADILDTAFSMRIRDAVINVLIPLLKKTEILLCGIAEREAETPQVGRTHGQHAVPITFGYAVSEYVARLGKSILKIEELVKDLRGKFAGATGSYNAASLIVKDPLSFEKKYLEYLNLLPSEYSHQLVEPEYMLRLLLEINISFGIIANLADDLRNLQRTEIGEVFEYFGEAQVGSSTMPQKRNPWNSEHVKSLWKTFSPRIISFYMDQISEHQRDLSNSASQRFIADYLTGFGLAFTRMNSILSGLQADRSNMLKNLTEGGGKVRGGVLAEPAYILLAQCGVSDAHEIIRKITLSAETKKIPFYEAVKENTEVFKMITEKLSELKFDKPEEFFAKPERYCGLADKKAKLLAEKYKNLM